MERNVSGEAMTDQKFLWWIHERMAKVHGESEFYDYMHHLRDIIADMDPSKETPNVARCDTAADLMRARLEPTRTNEPSA